jgi:hypothetical protein
LFNDSNPFLADPSSGLPIQTTGGLDWYVTTYGISDQAAVLGTFGFTELDEIIDNFIANKAPTDQMVFMGSKAYRVISKFLKNLASSGVTSVRLMIDGKTLDFEVEHLSYGGYEFDFVHVPIFDHPQLFSTSLRADVNGSLYFVPKDQVDTVDNGRQPRMQIRHTPTPFMGNAANKSANGIMTEWRTGALAEIPTPAGLTRLGSPATIEDYAHELYSALRAGDDQNLETIYVVPPVGDGLAQAINDRLQRAAF